jgi:hypothetical protein
MDAAESQAEEDCIVGGFELREFCPIDRVIKMEFDSKLREHVYLAKALDEWKFVFSNAIGVQAARQWICFEDGSADASAP